MTTNKPEIKIYEPSEKGVTAMRKASLRNTGPDRYVRLSDYEALRRDAELYRALRAMHWYDSPLAVVQNPKEAVKPGTYCPSGNQLDEILKEYMSETPNPGEA